MWRALALLMQLLPDWRSRFLRLTKLLPERWLILRAPVYPMPAYSAVRWLSQRLVRLAALVRADKPTLVARSRSKLLREFISAEFSNRACRRLPKNKSLWERPPILQLH